jgi:hypothetical protein
VLSYVRRTNILVLCIKVCRVFQLTLVPALQAPTLPKGFTCSALTSLSLSLSFPCSYHPSVCPSILFFFLFSVLFTTAPRLADTLLFRTPTRALDDQTLGTSPSVQERLFERCLLGTLFAFSSLSRSLFYHRLPPKAPLRRANCTHFFFFLPHTDQPKLFIVVSVYASALSRTSPPFPRLANPRSLSLRPGSVLLRHVLSFRQIDPLDVTVQYSL